MPKFKLGSLVLLPKQSPQQHLGLQLTGVLLNDHPQQVFRLLKFPSLKQVTSNTQQRQHVVRHGLSTELGVLKFIRAQRDFVGSGQRDEHFICWTV